VKVSLSDFGEKLRSAGGLLPTNAGRNSRIPLCDGTPHAAMLSIPSVRDAVFD
jgi:hypothetical protein